MEKVIEELLTPTGEDVTMIPLEPEARYDSLDVGYLYDFNSTRDFFQSMESLMIQTIAKGSRKGRTSS